MSRYHTQRRTPEQSAADYRHALARLEADDAVLEDVVTRPWRWGPEYAKAAKHLQATRKETVSDSLLVALTANDDRPFPEKADWEQQEAWFLAAIGEQQRAGDDAAAKALDYRWMKLGEKAMLATITALSHNCAEANRVGQYWKDLAQENIANLVAEKVREEVRKQVDSRLALIEKGIDAKAAGLRAETRNATELLSKANLLTSRVATLERAAPPPWRTAAADAAVWRWNGEHK